MALKNISTKLDAIIVAPHPDDAELGMGGGILAMLKADFKIGIVDLTDGEPTPFGSPEIRAQETKAASDVLGITWRHNLGLPNRSLEPTLDAREKLASIFRQTKPRWIFAPYWHDAHPDHLAATQLVEAARFWSKLSKTEMPGDPFYPERIYNYYGVHLKMHASPKFVLDISHHWERKLQSIACYQSQFIKGKEHLETQFLEQIRDEAAYWGKSIGVKYGEPFNCREPLGMTNFGSFV